MFTGIVEEVGRVLAVDLTSAQQSLVIGAQVVLDGTKLGDSIAVNGTCLTVTEMDGNSFSAGVVPETVRRTNLGDLDNGNEVNLERSVQPQSRLGGHFVQGHVDGVGTVAEVTPEGTALNLRIEARPELLRYVVEKGFVAMDGISLTVTGVDAGGFGVSLVPHTRLHVASSLWEIGHRVNLEVDILAKYVEKLVVH